MDAATLPPRTGQAQVKLAGIPEALKALPRWAMWRTEDKGTGGKPGKPPINPLTDRYASPTDPETWVSFDDAWKAYREGRYEGLSFAMLAEDGLVGIDLDNCRNPNNKGIAQWAAVIAQDLDSYTEVSPSGRGLRIFLRGSLPCDKGRHKGKVEAYSSAKFLTVTGHRLRSLPSTIEARPEALAAFYEKWFGDDGAESEAAVSDFTIDPSREPSPARLGQLFKRFAKAKAAYEGASDHPSPSERDQALANYAAGAGWHDQEIIDLLVKARANVGGEPKHLGYYVDTLRKARNSDLAKRWAKRKTPPKPLRTIKPQEEKPQAVMTLAEAKAVYSKWLYLEDTSAVDLVLALAAGNLLPGDPLWLHIMGPPSSGKTELIMSLDGLEDTFLLSNLTPAALISGYRDPKGEDEDHSLLPQLDGKLVLIKDFTVILSQGIDSRQEVFSILRDVYDGSACKAFGSSAPKRYDSRFNILAGVTNEIEREWKQNTLGERFLIYHLTVRDGLQHTLRAIGNANRGADFRAELRQAAQAVLAGIPRGIIPTLSPSLVTRTARLADVLATCRTYVGREKGGEVFYHPHPELGSRVAKQLLRIGQSLALVRGRSCVNEDDFTLMKRVALDSMPSIRLKVLVALWKHTRPISIKDLHPLLSTPESTTRRVLEDYELLKVVKRTMRRVGQTQKAYYELTPSIKDGCKLIDL